MKIPHSTHAGVIPAQAAIHKIVVSLQLLMLDPRVPRLREDENYTEGRKQGAAKSDEYKDFLFRIDKKSKMKRHMTRDTPYGINS
jgi:hypothetical protein